MFGRRCRKHEWAEGLGWMGCSNYLFTPPPTPNFCFAPFLRMRKAVNLPASVLPVFYKGEINAFGVFRYCQSWMFSLVLRSTICVERVISFNIGAVNTLVWFDSTGLVCMKSSTSVVELVMLLCSQVRFCVSSHKFSLSFHSVFKHKLGVSHFWALLSERAPPHVN